MGADYKFQPKQYPDRPVMRLSGTDEYVPATHIGMHTILRDPQNKSVYMSEARCQKMRTDTYKALFDLCTKYGSPSLAEFFNFCPAEMMSEAKLNQFELHPKLAPVSCLIECFETQTDKYLMISFGIDKKLLAEYFKNKDNSEFRVEDISPRKDREGKMSQVKLLFGEEEIPVTPQTRVKIERNALYRRFEHWCVLQDIDQETGLLMALEALCAAYPVDGLRDLDEYDVITEFDRALFEKPQRQAKAIVRDVKIGGTVYATANKIIARYNRDPVNLIRASMSFDDYANNALHLLNKSMDLKYQDPETYTQLKRIEQAEACQDTWDDK